MECLGHASSFFSSDIQRFLRTNDVQGKIIFKVSMSNAILMFNLSLSLLKFEYGSHIPNTGLKSTQKHPTKKLVSWFHLSPFTVGWKWRFFQIIIGLENVSDSSRDRFNCWSRYIAIAILFLPFFVNYQRLFVWLWCWKYMISLRISLEI